MKHSLLITVALGFCLQTQAQQRTPEHEEWKRKNDSTADAWQQRADIIRDDNNLTQHIKDSLTNFGAEFLFSSLCHERRYDRGKMSRMELSVQETFTGSMHAPVPAWGERITWFIIYNSADSIVERTPVGASAKQVEMGADLRPGVYYVDALPQYQYERAMAVKIKGCNESLNANKIATLNKSTGRRAAARLSGLYEKMGNYDSALRYFYMYDTSFNKNLNCAMMADLEEDEIAARYGELYEQAGYNRDGEKAMLRRRVFNWRGYDGETSKKLKQMFTKYEQPAALKTQIEDAVQHYFLDTTYETFGGKQYPYIYCCINFLGVKVRFFANDDGYYGFDNVLVLPGEDRYIANLKKSELYTLVEGLK